MRCALVLPFAVAIACGPTNEGPQAPAEKVRAADRTEVTVERSAVTAAPDPGAAPPPSTASTPAAPADPGEDALIGGAQAPAIERSIAPVRPRIRACYRKMADAGALPRGTVTYDVTIDKDGHVNAARFVKRDGLDDDMVGCLLTAMKAMTFTAGRKSEVITLSFGAGSTTGDAGTVK